MKKGREKDEKKNTELSSNRKLSMNRRRLTNKRLYVVSQSISFVCDHTFSLALALSLSLRVPFSWLLRKKKHIKRQRIVRWRRWNKKKNYTTRNRSFVPVRSYTHFFFLSSSSSPSSHRLWVSFALFRARRCECARHDMCACANVYVLFCPANTIAFVPAAVCCFCCWCFDWIH